SQQADGEIAGYKRSGTGCRGEFSAGLRLREGRGMMSIVNLGNVDASVIVLGESVPLAKRYLSIRWREGVLVRAMGRHSEMRLERIEQRLNRVEIMRRFLE